MEEAKKLAAFILSEKKGPEFYEAFRDQFSQGFDAERDLERIGVVNQTTMLASDTQAIADFLKQTMMKKFNLSESNIELHFADTRDTLCYATNDNQSAVSGMLEIKADLAIVVGGYNSSNTSHLVELCEEKLPTYFIKTEENLLSQSEILHYDLRKKVERLTANYLPSKQDSRILLTSGASCPDAMVESVIRKLAGYFQAEPEIEKLLESFG
jgi:4-hydroxy-3-methylbut-2-enyl diphosphate reductase